ncbi:MAG: hypothetical protein Q4D96_08380 [Propionibacteriaceae bacterium]|nr:hypothetical protein [Propionibacteriaceae bacterium]
MAWLMVLNALVALGSAAFGVVALVAPRAMPGNPLDGEATPGTATTYFAQMYAARAVPFGLGTAAVALLLPTQAATWFLVAGVVELFDALIVFRRARMQAIPPFVATVIHLASAWWLLS